MKYNNISQKKKLKFVPIAPQEISGPLERRVQALNSESNNLLLSSLFLMLPFSLTENICDSHSYQHFEKPYTVHSE